MDGWEERFDSAVGSLDVKISRLGERIEMEISAVRSEIRAGDEETRRRMRLLHEDIIDRIARIGEGAS